MENFKYKRRANSVVNCHYSFSGFNMYQHTVNLALSVTHS